MALRTTVAKVQQIIDYDQDLIPNATPFLETANLLVTEVVAIAPVPSDAVLELVERYLAAHFIGITDPRLQSAQVKSILESYQSKIDKGLELTHWGQMAMLLDTTGRLSAFNAKQVAGLGKASLWWAGVDE